MGGDNSPVVLISGAASGIGASTAGKFLATGASRIAAVDIATPEAGLFPSESDRWTFHKCDVSDERSVGELVESIDRRFGRIDKLINVAGIVLVKPVTDTTWEEFQRLVNVNLGGTWLLCKHAIPLMKRQGGGVIVNVASVSGHVGQVDHSLYGATKGAVIAFTRGLAWELAPYNIRVNSVSPGSVDTPMLRSDIATESRKTGLTYDEVKARREGEQAFGRWAQPSEIAEAVYFLATDAASFITGTDLLVDCGWVAR